jgi:precorrin-6A synthase
MMTKINLFLVGIGTGNPDHVTRQAEQMLRAADIIMIPHKGTSKSDLADLRYQICGQLLGTESPPIFSFELPERDPDKSYLAAVDDWHDTIALVWADTIQNASAKLDQPVKTVALLIWGDPSLYDSSMRIAARLDPKPTITVAPGITSVQALAAAHKIPVNNVAAPFLVTTGRRLRDEGFPNHADTAIIMLDGNCSFTSLNGAEFDIWWGAYLGMPEQILVSGPLNEVGEHIISRRAAARRAHGWIMDTYLLKRRGVI